VKQLRLKGFVLTKKAPSFFEALGGSVKLAKEFMELKNKHGQPAFIDGDNIVSYLQEGGTIEEAKELAPNCRGDLAEFKREGGDVDFLKDMSEIFGSDTDISYGLVHILKSNAPLEYSKKMFEITGFSPNGIAKLYDAGVSEEYAKEMVSIKKGDRRLIYGEDAYGVGLTFLKKNGISPDYAERLFSISPNIFRSSREIIEFKEKNGDFEILEKFIGICSKNNNIYTFLEFGKLGGTPEEAKKWLEKFGADEILYMKEENVPLEFALNIITIPNRYNKDRLFNSDYGIVNFYNAGGTFEYAKQMANVQRHGRRLFFDDNIVSLKRSGATLAQVEAIIEKDDALDAYDVVWRFEKD